MTEEFQHRDFKVANDIYSLAFAALIHPDEVGKTEDGIHMPRIDLLNDERESLYISAMLVTLTQFTTIILINHFFEELPNVITKADKFEVMIPRLLSSLMMHL